MTPRLLEYFLRIAELGSINRAARDLHVSQPALSRHLAALEHEVGAPLLLRDPRGVRLTDAGKQLSERARPILRQIELLRGELADQTEIQVALAMPPSLQRSVTVPLVLRVVAELPHVSLKVYEGMSHAVRDWLAGGSVDLGITAFQARPLPNCDQSALVREPLFAVARRGGPLGEEAEIPLARLGAMKLILPGRPNAIRLVVENQLRRAGRAYRSAAEVETLGLCLELARHGVGTAVVPRSAILGHPDAGQLAAARIRGLYVTWALHASRSREHATAVRRVRALLEQVASESLAESAPAPRAERQTPGQVAARTLPSSLK